MPVSIAATVSNPSQNAERDPTFPSVAAPMNISRYSPIIDRTAIRRARSHSLDVRYGWEGPLPALPFGAGFCPEADEKYLAMFV
jgi:hypothetical protein